jgi:hypothetical protein
MRQAKHTPGPWALCIHLRNANHDEICKCGYRGGIWSADGETIVCEMGGTPNADGVRMLPECDRDTAKANARLIAAAPELLKENEENAEQMRRASTLLRELGYENMAIALSVRVTLTEQVIAKARGETEHATAA